MEVGGYFGLELSEAGTQFHQTPFRFKSGRASLGFILKLLKPAKVYVPFYTCDALLAPFHEFNVPYTFYKINKDFELTELPELRFGELIVYINYFDIKRAYVQELSGHYKHQLIIDCTQAYFLTGNGQSWLFNSSRKFFGVPDGSDLYVPENQDIDEAYSQLTPNQEFLTDHLIARFNGDTSQGYEYFKQNEILCGKGIYQMSKLTEHLLSNVDYETMMRTRKNNFSVIHQQLAESNQLNINEYNSAFFYPYLPAKFIDKKIFWESGLFVPIFWPDCIDRDADSSYLTETNISTHLIPIPIDHRYDTTTMYRVADIIKTYN